MTHVEETNIILSFRSEKISDFGLRFVDACTTFLTCCGGLLVRWFGDSGVTERVVGDEPALVLQRDGQPGQVHRALRRIVSEALRLRQRNWSMLRRVQALLTASVKVV